MATAVRIGVAFATSVVNLTESAYPKLDGTLNFFKGDDLTVTTKVSCIDPTVSPSSEKVTLMVQALPSWATSCAVAATQPNLRLWKRKDLAPTPLPGILILGVPMRSWPRNE